MQKKLAKIPPADLRILFGMLPRLEAEEREMRQILIDRRGDLFANDCVSPSWSHLYELPLAQHTARLVIAFGEEDTLKDIAGAARPVQVATSFIQELDDDDSVFSPKEKEAIRPQLALIFGLVTSILRSLHSLMAYGVYLNELVAQVRLGGRKADEALFKALKIDPTAIASPSIHARISQAVLEDDKTFMASLKRSINAPLSKQHKANADKIRFVLQVLAEAKVEQLSDDELHDLFVKQLRLYSATSRQDSGDPAKGIRAIERRMRQAKATT